MTRAGLILIRNEKLALIERYRDSQHYYIFPGGQVETGESFPQTVIREAQEELGLVVNVGPLIAEIIFHNIPQYYFLVTECSGEFGSGKGPEMVGLYPAENGTYLPVWLPVQDLDQYDIRPRQLIPIVIQGNEGKWPANTIFLRESFKGNLAGKNMD